MRRNIFATASIIVVFLIAAALVLLDRPQAPGSTTVTPSQDATNLDTPEKNGENVENFPEKKETEVDSKTQIKKTVDIPVTNNSAEFELKVSIYQNGMDENYIKFRYYNEGTEIEKEFGSQLMPELKEIFLEGGVQPGGKCAMRVKSTLLNPIKGKVYIILRGEPLGEMSYLSLYVYNLKNSSMNRLYSESGNYTDFIFSKNYKYLAFSYLDSPASSKFQECSLLQVLECDSDRFLVNGSRDLQGTRIGKDKDPECLYDYIFTGWYTNSIIRVKESKYPKKSNGTNKEHKELLYDIEKNLFLNPDGSEAQENQAVQPSAAQKKESETVKALRSLYVYMSSDEQFQKAYDMLDDQFVLKLNMLAQFGITELRKSDLDVASYSAFSSLFKAAQIDSIVKENSSGNTTTLYYYQSIASSNGEPVKQPIIAVFKKTDKGVKVLSLMEGNMKEKPFSK